ncbi:MAG: helix-turn-helix transcriptional regulator [Azonexus sp.]|nr:helix-turn-helix transcriptional regulator [Azonexus sp.]MDZ4313648.1 helix-turn-helix transcriptional regulator [Azonexus sp.]
MDSLGKRLRTERERLGLNQDALGVAPKTQRFYENGERSPDATYLEAFARLGADVGYILTGVRSTCVLAPDEAALLDNYRNSTPDNQAVLRKVGAALEKQVDDDGEMCA